MTYKDMKESTLQHPAVHFWVKDTLKIIDEKDPVDVLHGLKLLTSLIEKKCREA